MKPTELQATYQNTVRELESRGIMPDRAPSLLPVSEGLKRILKKSLTAAKKTIVVAGTNGKGSVCATLEALFLSAGESVGLYTSPHLEETTERIRLNGRDVSKELFCNAYNEVLKKTQDIQLSHFEMLTLMAAWLFYSGKIAPKVDRPIFEVGLGGKWDATNAIPHHNCVITSLGYDHQNLLGNTLEEIAGNKFGIISRLASVVHSPLPKEVLELANTTRIKTKSHWVESASVSWKVEYEKTGPRFIIQTPWGEAPLALAGPRAIENTATALTLFKELGYSPEKHLSALSQVRWVGRMDQYNLYKGKSSPCPIYLSGDHNVDGIKSLLELLPYYPRNRLYILVGVVQDKDLNGILSPLSSIPNSSLFLTETSFRTRPLSQYDDWLTRADGSFKSPEDALLHLISIAKSNDMILVTGSLYLVGQLKKCLTKNP